MIDVYVDGSYKNGKVGWGTVIVKSNEVYGVFNGVVDEKEVDGSRQVAGELKAVKEAVFWAKQQNVHELNIYYDYKGIEAWVTGEWKAKKPVSQNYKNYIMKSKIKLNWFKVKSHSGNKFNDMADELAKEAIF